MPRFSIIIPAFRAEKFLPLAIASIKAQTFPDWEAIIVDDGSERPEMTRQVNEACARDSRIRSAVLPVNMGLPAARNQGLANAKGDYIAFLDSDDLMMTWTLQVLNDVIERENEPSFIAGSAAPVPESDERAAAQFAMLAYRRFPTYLDYRMAEKPWWFAPSGVAIKRSVLAEAGGFWEGRDYCEDLDLWQRLGTSQGFIRIDVPATYGYRIHQESMHHRHREMYRGIERIIGTEMGGRYPGGKQCRKKRVAIIAAHSRHHTVEFCAENPDLAWKLYWKTFRWNLELCRVKFLIGFPLLALKGKWT